VFLCDYIAIEDFRREIHTLLNRGESVHQLQRAVYSGKVAPERGRAGHEALAALGCAVQWHEYPMGHELCLEEVQALSAWLRQAVG
jgi:predicted esterase